MATERTPSYDCPGGCGFRTSSEFGFLMHVSLNTDCQDRIGRRRDEDRDSFMIRFMDAHTAAKRAMGWA